LKQLQVTELISSISNCVSSLRLYCAAFKSTHTDCFSSLQFVLERSLWKPVQPSLGRELYWIQTPCQPFIL